MENEISLGELTVRSSIQIFQANPTFPRPVGFGSGCILRYQDRNFLASVSHVTDTDGLTTYLESNLPFDEKGPIIHPIGEIQYFDILQLKSSDDVKEVEDFEEFLNSGKRLDVCFAEIKEPIELIQIEDDYGFFKVQPGLKLHLFLDKVVAPNKDDYYAFAGRIKHEYIGDTLSMTNTFKHSLKYHRQSGNLCMFLADEIIRDKEDYEGCSGAPILNSEGRIVALACAIRNNTKIVYGFPILELKKLLDYSLQIENL